MKASSRISRRTAVVSGLAGGAGLLAGGPNLLARAAPGTAVSRTPGAAALALASHMDVRSPAFRAFLHELGMHSALASGAGGIAPEPTFAPIPAIGRGPAISTAGYLVQEIRGGLYWVTDGAFQCLFLLTGQGVIVVDAPPSIGPNLPKAIASVTSEPVTHIVYSHVHSDHIGAASILSKTATIIAHEATAAYLRRDNDAHRPVPTMTFTDTYTLRVGDQVLQLSYKGENHVAGNIFIYAPRQKVLMLVDVVFPGWVPFDYLAVSTYIPGYITAYDQTLTYPFDTFVGGHVTRLGTRHDILMGREYLHDLKVNCAMALQTVDYLAIAQKVGYGNVWAVSRTYLDTVVDRATAATLAKWQGRLGGADVFTHDNCYAMQSSLRTD